MISRRLYTHSNVTINGSGLLVQSFDFNNNLGHEQIEEYGNENFYQVIGEPVSASCTINCYPESGNFSNLIQQYVTHTKSSSPDREFILSDFGGLDHSLLTSLKLDAAIGSVPTASLNFVGAISISVPLTPSTSAGEISTIPSVESVQLNGGDACAQRISVDWAIPVSSIPKYDESLSYPTGFFGDPVGVTTISAQGVGSFLDIITSVNFGGINVAFDDVKVISSGINQSVGSLAATYNLAYQCSSNNVTFS